MHREGSRHDIFEGDVHVPEDQMEGLVLQKRDCKIGKQRAQEGMFFPQTAQSETEEPLKNA